LAFLTWEAPPTCQLFIDLFSLQDGQLQAGDQLLKVDGQSLVGITQEK